MPLEIPTNRLRPPQLEAINTIINYLDAYHAGETTEACLINMPTGSGKSGVITCCCRCLDNINSALVLSPRIAIRDQLYTDIKSGFFDIIGENPDKKNQPFLIKNSSTFAAVDDHQDKSYVLTIQSIISLYKNNNDSFNSISNNIDIVLVDEGHYEPAPTWGNAIRSLNAPKIIFTATPFRNDLKSFDISCEHTYCYTFTNAANDNIIRSVEFVELPNPNSENEFVDSIVNYFDNEVGEEDSKVIIQCEDSNSIRRITSRLREMGKDCVSIHEKFANTPERSWEYKKVPDPRTTDATYWVHQFKLLEGIDEPSFKLLAIHTPLTNSRMLIQQIGRIVRNTSNEPETAIVLDHSNGVHRIKWDRFITYDQMLSADPQAIEIAIGEKLTDRFFEAQPQALYHAREFRPALDLNKISINDDVYINLSANIFYKPDFFSLDDTCSKLESFYSRQDYKKKKYTVSDNCIAYLYVKIENSPILESNLFLENKLCITVIIEKDSFIYQYDSSGIRLDGITDISPVNSSKKLNKLFRDDNRARITDISLKNSNLGASSIRGKRLNAFSMEEISPQLDDHAQIYISARGNESSIEGRTRRYISFRKGKISDSKRQKLKMADYTQWVDFINGRLTDDHEYQRAKAFAKYSSEMQPPENTDITHILVDFSEASKIFVRNIDNREFLKTDDAASAVVNGEFSLRLNDTDYTFKINYHKAKHNYLLSCPQTADQYISLEPDVHGSDLVDYLNKNQSFRAIPKTSNYIYAYGQFYQPFIKYGEDFEEHKYIFDSFLHNSTTLTTTASEKGKKCKVDGSGWEDGCLFEIIRTLGAGTDLENLFTHHEIDILVCDDMGYESADFILASSKTNFIAACHAKAKREASYVSASHLHDVCSQASKNIGYLSPYTTLEPTNKNRWEDAWTAHGVEGTVARRIIVPKRDTADQVWGKLKKIIQDPYSEKQVWIALGQILSKNQFLQNVAQEPPPKNSIQALYLIQSTSDSVSSIGAKLKILCSD